MTYIYPERESKSLEFKSKPPQFKNLIKTCIAFANGIGGKIIIGIEDRTREIIGVDEEIKNRIYDEFPNSVYDATSPSLLVEIYERNFKDLSLIIIDVPPSIKKPVFLKADGIPAGVYLRAGSNTRKASAESVEELMRENKRVYFDEEIIQADPAVLSTDLLNSIFGKVTETRLVSEKVLNSSGTSTKTYHPTVAGILSFCEAPEIYIPEALIQCTQFHGTEGREIIQSQEIRGSIEAQITHSFELVCSWLTRDYKLRGAKLKHGFLVPEVALREVIINALIHRKYTIAGSVKIALYQDRLEIFSPGNFPGLVDIHNLGDGTTYLRNPHLARLARRFGLIEKLGTGIRLILETCQEAGLKKPEFIEGADSVKVVFYFVPATTEENFDHEEDQLLALFNTQEETKITQVQKYLNISRNTATRKLQKLVDQGKIRRMGKGPAVRYVKNSA